jgi:hypothetical protein
MQNVHNKRQIRVLKGKREAAEEKTQPTETAFLAQDINEQQINE